MIRLLPSSRLDRQRTDSLIADVAEAIEALFAERIEFNDQQALRIGMALGNFKQYVRDMGGNGKASD